MTEDTNVKVHFLMMVKSTMSARKLVDTKLIGATMRVDLGIGVQTVSKVC